MVRPFQKDLLPWYKYRARMRVRFQRDLQFWLTTNHKKYRRICLKNKDKDSLYIFIEKLKKDLS